MSLFEKGDLVGWSHREATKHAPGSILYASVLGEPGDEPGSGQRGTIVGPANEQETWWDVKLDGDTLTLTGDELVKLLDDEAAA